MSDRELLAQCYDTLKLLYIPDAPLVKALKDRLDGPSVHPHIQLPTLKQCEILLKQHAGDLTDGWYQIDAGTLMALIEDWLDEHNWQNPPRLNSAWRKRHSHKYVSEDEIEP